jgi:Tfp pilus assembly protein PilO
MRADALKTAGAGLLAGLIAGWLIALRPALAERDRLAGTGAPLAQRLETQQQRLTERDIVVAAIKQRRQALRAHPMRLPPTPDESRLVSHLASLSADAGLRALDIDPGKTRTTPRHQRRRLSVRVTGDWAALRRFLDDVERTTRGIALAGLTLADADRGTLPDDAAQTDRLALELELDAYWQAAPPALSPSVDSAGGWITPAADPRPAPAPRANPFAAGRPSLAIAETDIRYIGRILRGDRQWALIRRPDGALMRRQQGQAIGTLGRLAGIRADALMLGPGAGNPDAPTRIIPRYTEPSAAGE